MHRRGILGVGCWLLPVVVGAATVLPEVAVEAQDGQQAQNRLSVSPEALPAEVLIIDAQDVNRTAVSHYTDLFRKQPGMLIGTYGQGGVSDNFAMRGFSGDHASDVALFIDGVPMNLPHNSQHHGFADISWISPELIDRIEIIKGPASALYGNFALGGAINIITKKRDSAPAIALEVGGYGTVREVASISGDFGRMSPFLVYEAFHQDGYRDNQDWERYNLFNKLSTEWADGSVSLRLHAAKGEWGAPGYLPIDAVKSGQISRSAAIDASDGGDSAYYDLVASYEPQRGEAGWYATLYMARSQLDRYANFSFPADAASQSLNRNDRVYGGWKLMYHWLPSERWSVMAGSDGRYDDGSRRRYASLARVPQALTDSWDYTEWNLALFAQGQVKVTDTVKVTAAVRYDRFDTDIDNLSTPANSGSATPSMVSPKLGVNWSVLPRINLFANLARGFRSPSVEEMSPNGGTANFDLEVAELKTADVGINAWAGDKVYLAFDYYRTSTEGEIVNLGNQNLNVGDTTRNGYEAEVKYYPLANLSLFANYSGVDAKLDNPAVTGADEIPGVPKNYLNLGAGWTLPVANASWLFDVYLQQQGKTPLDETGAQTRSTLDRYVLKAQYQTRRWSAYGAATILPEQDHSEGEFGFNGGSYDPKPVAMFTVGGKYQF